MGQRIRKHVALVVRVGALMLTVSMVAPKAASADVWCWLFGDDCKRGSSSRQSADRATPEIDPAGLAGAFALAAGGAAVLGDRLRRRR